MGNDNKNDLSEIIPTKKRRGVDTDLINYVEKRLIPKKGKVQNFHKVGKLRKNNNESESKKD